MIPVVALVGRPNVGKSTLFNQLTRTRDALVADVSGLTRDRQYGRAEVEGHEFIIIDTGGIDDDTTKGIKLHIVAQSLQAIKEADVVLFIVDARTGLMHDDKIIAKYLRSRGIKTSLVVNKIDGVDINTVIGDFYSLGLGKIHLVSASHRRGVTQFIKDFLKPFIITECQEVTLTEEQNTTAYWTLQKAKNIPEEDYNFDFAQLPIKLAIVGRPNVGKSTLINCLLGEDRMIVFNMPGTTRDSIYIPMERDDRKYILIDTAGVRKRKNVTEIVDKFSISKTLQAIEDANVVLFVIDAREILSDQDLSMLSFIINMGRSLVLVVNKSDGVPLEDRKRIKDMIEFRLKFFNFTRIHFISAFYASGISGLFKSVEEAYKSATRHVSTSLLTRIMKMAENEYQPPRLRGRRIKMKYAHAGGYNPPVVIIHGNQVSELSDSYKRYLMSYFRRFLEVVGTPIKIHFKEGKNPYAKKKNQLTVAQVRKRKRLMQYLKK
ncbi:GTPase Der [Candidatus Hartigia pinicola]|nr:GTPase Der [Candidatus Hartigia pinicola]